MDQAEKDAFDENARNNVEYKKRADEIIKEATDKANEMKKKCDAAKAEVEKLKDDNAKMADDLDYMRGGEKRITPASVCYVLLLCCYVGCACVQCAILNTNTQV